MTLRGSSQDVAEKLKAEIQSRVEIAGIEILEARITHLAYAPEIAAVMLQRQQATAIIDARKMIVDGAVGMVEMALAKLSENNIVDLDEERKAAMVSNLLVVLCGNRDPSPSSTRDLSTDIHGPEERKDKNKFFALAPAWRCRRLGRGRLSLDKTPDRVSLSEAVRRRKKSSDGGPRGGIIPYRF
jgi:hypothetical protein